MFSWHSHFFLSFLHGGGVKASPPFECLQIGRCRTQSHGELLNLAMAQSRTRRNSNWERESNCSDDAYCAEILCARAAGSAYQRFSCARKEADVVRRVRGLLGALPARCCQGPSPGLEEAAMEKGCRTSINTMRSKLSASSIKVDDFLLVFELKRRRKNNRRLC